MSDIVERLRHCADNCGDEYLRELSGRAADEIERLKAKLLERDAVWLPEKDAEIERLRTALREISDCKTFTDRKYMIDIARDALKEDGDE